MELWGLCALSSNWFKAKTIDVQADAEIVSASAWTIWISCSSDQLCSFPNLIEDFRRKRRLVLRQESAVMLLNDIRCFLDGIAGLLVGSGLLEDMRC